jgi:hypothetical protein
MKSVTAHRRQSHVLRYALTVEKIALFRRLFGGRSEGFLVRWENRNTGKSGYAPACANEWVRGVCGKPKVNAASAQTRPMTKIFREVIARTLKSVAKASSV